MVNLMARKPRAVGHVFTGIYLKGVYQLSTHGNLRVSTFTAEFEFWEISENFLFQDRKKKKKQEFRND